MTADKRFLEHCVQLVREKFDEPGIRVGQRDFQRGAYLIVGPDDSEVVWIDDQLVQDSEQDEIVKRIEEAWSRD